jgi:hypothetical protein
VRLHFPNLRLQSAWFSDLAETKLVEIEIPDETSLFLPVGAGEIITIRVQLF